MDSKSQPEIMNFTDYRQYLREYYDFMKDTTAFFSHRYFMRKAGIASPNFLKNVMEGRKNLTKETVLKFARALGFTPRETDYFENLVFFEQAPTSERKQYYYDRLRLFSRGIVRTLVQSDQSEYFAKWYHCVVRELVAVRDYHDDWARLGKDVRPRITPSRARKSVETLLRLGLVRRNSDGTYAQTARNVTAGDNPVAVMHIRQYHKDSLKNAAAAIDSVPATRRSCTSVVMSIDEATYRDIEAEIKEFRNRISLIANTTKSSDRVYQVAIQMFPVSNIGRRSG
jgi:uncharacterized protein (TIGR02147 family)